MAQPHDEVRRYLESYRAARFEVVRLRRKLTEIRARCESITRELNGMPGGGGGDKHQDGTLVAYADLAKSYEVRFCEAEKLAKEIEEFVNNIPDPTLRMILWLRYVDLLPWSRVQEELATAGVWYSERQITRLHGLALQSARGIWNG